MSYTREQLDTILDIQADFDLAVSQQNWPEAAAMIEQMGELGFETEALYLHKRLNSAKATVGIQMDTIIKGLRV